LASPLVNGDANNLIGKIQNGIGWAPLSDLAVFHPFSSERSFWLFNSRGLAIFLPLICTDFREH
jgi:hypothetical protein